MKMNRLCVAVYVAAGVLCASGSVYGGDNLILNGSFENGLFEGDADTSFTFIPAGGTAVDGWVGTQGGFDWHQAVEFGPAFDGYRMVDLTAGIGLGGISQMFTTAATNTYRLTFALAGPRVVFQNPRSVLVSVAGISQTFTVPASEEFPLAWELKTLTFTAIADTTTLEFAGSGNGEYWGAVIDSISVVRICMADFDGDEFVSGTDFDQYVVAFEASDLSADFDGNGFVNALDFDLFVQAFEEGC